MTGHSFAHRVPEGGQPMSNLTHSPAIWSTTVVPLIAGGEKS